MMPMYAKRVPTWSQNRCQKSFKINEKSGNETAHGNHEQLQNATQMEPEIIIVSSCSRKGNFRQLSVLLG